MEALLAREFERQIRLALDRVSDTYTVVTPLAEGADRLVAREVLKRPNSRMEVVLPMLEADYFQTFDTDAARDEFRRMIAGHSLLVLRQEPIPTGEGRSEALEDAYWASGEYVVRNCDILFALWDGLPSKGRGGTSNVVEFARKLGRAIVILWTDGKSETVAIEGPPPRDRAGSPPDSEPQPSPSPARVPSAKAS